MNVNLCVKSMYGFLMTFSVYSCNKNHKIMRQIGRDTIYIMVKTCLTATTILR